MAGVKGKSGGTRPGAGRKPKPKQEPVCVPDTDMLSLLQDVALGRVNATPTQVRAAIAAVQYTHVKKADCGKKAEDKAKAERVSERFKTRTPPPRLVVNNR